MSLQALHIRRDGSLKVEPVRADASGKPPRELMEAIVDSPVPANWPYKDVQNSTMTVRNRVYRLIKVINDYAVYEEIY